MPFSLYISQAIIHHQHNYLLSLRGFTGLHVVIVKALNFRKLKFDFSGLTMIN